MPKITIRMILLAILAVAAVYTASTATTVDDQIVKTAGQLVDQFFPADTSTTTVVSPTTVN